MINLNEIRGTMKTNPLLFIFLGWMLIAFSPALSAEEITVEA